MRESFDWAQREKNSLIRRSGPLSCVRIVGQRIGVALYGVWSYAGFSISDFLPTCPNCGGVSEFDCQWKSRVASRGWWSRPRKNDHQTLICTQCGLCSRSRSACCVIHERRLSMSSPETCRQVSSNSGWRSWSSVATARSQEVPRTEVVGDRHVRKSWKLADYACRRPDGNSSGRGFDSRHLHQPLFFIQ